MSDRLPIELALWAGMALAGLVLGVGYFKALRRSVTALCGGSGRLAAAGFVLARLGGAVLVLGLAARLGAVPLLATFAGFVAARALALRAAGAP